MLTYAVGDTHGCLDLLDRLLERIAADAKAREHRLVILGDYIDRGPDSAGVVARIRALQDGAPPESIVALKGNHEDLLLRAIGDPDAEALWLRNGGDATLASYGVRHAAGIPGHDLDWFASLLDKWEDEQRIFVHAGLRPGRPRDAQDPHDLIWIRDEFLEEEADFGLFVVHGHTPRRRGVPDLRRFRVNLDTAAVYGGRLTAGVFEDGSAAPIRFLQVP